MTAPLLQADCAPLLIGSLPLEDHRQAVQMVLQYTPEIPLWIQLPAYPQERMIAQFLPGMPGLRETDARQFVDTAAADFDADLLTFYEEYMQAVEDDDFLRESRFTLSPKVAPGLPALLESVVASDVKPRAIKGQVTGPFTFCTGVKDPDGSAIFYNPQLRDAAVKLLALKTRSQVLRLAAADCPVLVFFDEPALAGFGTSEFISIGREEVAECLGEVIEAAHGAGALAGIHVCANTDWSLVLESGADVVSFDAYSYFDRFMLYADSIRQFLSAGKLMAWGIVPTGDVAAIEAATTEALVEGWREKQRAVEALGIDRAALFAQSLITPSCGAGSLTPPAAEKVLRLTREVSDRIRDIFGAKSA